MANYRYGFVARTLDEWEAFAKEIENATGKDWVPNLGEYIFIKTTAGEITHYFIGDKETPIKSEDIRKEDFLSNETVYKIFPIDRFLKPVGSIEKKALQDAIIKEKTERYDAINSLKTEIDNLTNIMNFRGIFSSPNDIDSPKSGDVYLNFDNNNEYIFNGSKWIILGNSYSDTRIHLPLRITTDFGYFTLDGNPNRDIKTEDFNGQEYITLEAFIKKALQQEKNPDISMPTAEITASGGTEEVGSGYTLPTATLKITSVGTYEYGPDTGITFAIGDVELKQGSNSKKNDVVMVKDSTIVLQATDSATLYTDTAKRYTFTATASHSEGAIPVTNLGNEYADAQIAAGNITIADKTVTYSGYRKAFAGGTDVVALDSAAIRAATATKNSFSAMDTQSKALEFTATAGTTKVFFAYPSKWQVGLKKPYFEMFGLAWAENSGFIKEENDIQVADARGTIEGVLQNPIAYKVYSWTPSGGPLTAESTKFRVWFK